MNSGRKASRLRLAEGTSYSCSITRMQEEELHTSTPQKCAHRSQQEQRRSSAVRLAPVSTYCISKKSCPHDAGPAARCQRVETETQEREKES